MFPADFASSRFMQVFLTVLIISVVTVVESIGAADPPNIEQLTYAINLLLGKPPAEQQQAARQRRAKLFEFSAAAEATSHGFYKKYSELLEINNSENCMYSKETNSTWYGMSSATLDSQTSSSQSSFNPNFTIGISRDKKKTNPTPSPNSPDVNVDPAPALPPELDPTSATISLVVTSGNSEISGNASIKMKGNFTYSFNAQSSRSLYNARLNYAKINENMMWTPEFLQDSENLGDAPSLTQLLMFIDKYGTHGLEKVQFGQKCTSSLYFEKHTDFETMINFQQDEASYTEKFEWWPKSPDSQIPDETETSEKHKCTYTFSDRKCIGELVRDSSCGGGLYGTGIVDSPAIISWTYMPIWEMGIKELNGEPLKKLIQDVFVKLEECGDEKCNSHGICAIDASIWDDSSQLQSVKKVNDIIDDPPRCFCYDNFEGEACDQSTSVNLYNIARFGAASQSSTNHDGIAILAIDGNTNGEFNEQHSVTHTSEGKSNPFWKVRWLDTSYRISRIKVWNRTDGWTDRIKGFVVKVQFEGQEVWSSGESAVDTNKVTTTYDFADIPDGIIGNEVIISLKGDNKVLSLAEVEVWGIQK